MLLFTRLADRILTVAPLLHGSVCLLSVVCHVCIVAKQYIRYRKTVWTDPTATLWYPDHVAVMLRFGVGCMFANTVTYVL